MANQNVLPFTVVNGVDPVDADESMANWNYANDRIYRSPTAPATPYLSQFWVKSDEPEDSPLLLQMWTGTKWKAIVLADIE